MLFEDIINHLPTSYHLDARYVLQVTEAPANKTDAQLEHIPT